MVGGIAGALLRTSLDDCRFRGSIDIPTEHSENNVNYVGGVAGRVYTDGGNLSFRIYDSSSTGNITYNCKSTGPLYLGGVAGSLSGTNDTYRVEIDKCSYSDGKILVTDAHSGKEVYVGGFAGYVGNFAAITNSYSAAAEVQAAKTETLTGDTGILYVGGFIGRLNEVNLSGCYSSSYVNIPNTQNGSGACYIGGFVGDLSNAKVEDCYATGNVDSYGLNQQYIGGLVGNSVGTGATHNEINRCYAAGTLYAESRYIGTASFFFSVGGLVGYADYTDINESYAKGAVTAKKRVSTSGPINAGGLAGLMRHDSSIRNSWASGNVLADNPFTDGYSPCAGGLVGYIYPDSESTCTVEYCYSRGSVISRSANNTNLGAYAGGLVGRLYLADTGRTIKINHSVYLGPSVSAASVYNATAARVYGYSDNQGTRTLSDNYASTAAVVETSTYAALTGTPVTFTPGHNSQHAANVSPAVLSSSGFWTGTAGFNGTGGNVWDFSHGVSAEGPKLKNVQ
jgi:hypothetical protein